MQFPLSWLQEFIDLPESPEIIEQHLNNLGLEVDSIESVPPDFSGVVVGEVLETSPHPEADKLTVASVHDGKEHFQVVCGAPNCRPGIKVAFARVGAKLDLKGDKPLKIKKGKLRGVESFGMLCSGKELGLSDEDSGISELPSSYTLGLDLADLHAEVIVEISLTPNLAHCFSLLGIARELSARLKRPLKKLPLSEAKPLNLAPLPINLTVEDTKSCPFYSATMIEGVSVAPSPLWLQKRLEQCGMRPVNNIVDMTNYILLGYGQPLHAFDADKIAGASLSIRPSSSGESCTTLDGKQRALPEGTLIIADGHSPQAIAGIMGGEQSEVTEETKRILLECAWFSPSSIRKGVQALYLSSESSKRFERGVDPSLPLTITSFVAEEIARVASGTISGASTISSQQEKKGKPITCSLSKMQARLGREIDFETAKTTLESLDCQLSFQQDQLQVTPPSYRFDLAIEEDIMEELARHIGYEAFAHSPATFTASELADDASYLFEKHIRHSLLSLGLQEVIHVDLISSKECIEIFPISKEESFPSLQNTCSEVHRHMRSSLLGAFLKTLQRNTNGQVTDLATFEIGKVYRQKKEEYEETAHLGLLLTGKKSPSSWQEHAEPWSFFDLKGKVESLLARCHINDVRFTSHEHPAFQPGQTAAAYIGDELVGFLGKLHPELLLSWGLEASCFYAELQLPPLQPRYKIEGDYQPIPAFPGSTRDLTLAVEESAQAGDILLLLQSIQHKLLMGVELISIFEDKESSSKKLSFRFTYRDTKKTLSHEAIERTHNWVVSQTEKLVK